MPRPHRRPDARAGRPPRRARRSLGCLGLLGALGAAVAFPAVAAGAPASTTSTTTGGATATTAAAPAGSAGLKGVVDEAVAAVARARWARISIASSTPGHRAYDTVTAGPGQGVSTSEDGAEVLHLRYLRHTIYLEGKGAVLSALFGMPSYLADRYSGRWLSAPTSVRTVAELSTLFSLRTLARNLVDLSGPLSRSPAGARVGGHPVIMLRGTIARTKVNAGDGAGDRATLVLSAAAPHLPVSLAFGDTADGSTRITFSHWGVAAPVSAPAHPVPLSQIGAAQPAG